MTRRNPGLAVAEDVARQKVDPPHGKDDDAGSDYDAPERQAECLLARCGLIEIAEHVVPDYQLGECEKDEAMGGAE